MPVKGVTMNRRLVVTDRANGYVRDVGVIEYPLGLAIKIVIPRRVTAGDPGDRDVYGAQQHQRLMGIEL